MIWNLLKIVKIKNNIEFDNICVRRPSIMPPRKRKRKDSSTSRKPPLIFTESPINKRHNLPSPVFSADFPIQASVVHIDDNLQIPWVSPQFRGKALTMEHGMSKRTRRSRKPSGPGPVTRKRNNSKENLTSKPRPLPKGMIPLAFIDNPKSLETISIIEDVSIEDCDSEKTQTPKTKSGANGIHMSRYISPNGNIIPCIGARVTRSKTNKICPVNAKSNNEENVIQNDGDISTEDIESDTADEIDTNKTKKPWALRHNKSKPTTPSLSQLIRTPPYMGIYTKTKPRNVQGEIEITDKPPFSDDSIEDIEVTTHTTDTDSSPLFMTQKRPKRRTKQGKRLFQNSRSELSSNDSSIENKDSDADLPNIRSKKKTLTLRKISFINNSTNEIHNQSITDIETDSDGLTPRRRSLRLRRKYLQLFSKVIGSPHTPSQRPYSNILAHDTPEIHYGLSYREKQLLGLIDI
ncbi:unnamed protein product [Owenia fusiformis]|uniref:Uncharacterized protein n=1 Tax=Owenia fusiformis TaxID=6347 RepID=A0A8J1U2J7_OWEFU|nr:unnamed protein product [Owenia fusiformis]